MTKLPQIHDFARVGIIQILSTTKPLIPTATPNFGSLRSQIFFRKVITSFGIVLTSLEFAD